MKILVTGGLGFIGHKVVSILEHLGHQVVIIDNQSNSSSQLIKERSHQFKTKDIFNIDIIDQKSVERVISIFKPEIIVHLASFPNQKATNNYPILASVVMTQGLITMLELAKTYKVSRFVYISSSMVYGNFEDDVKEDAVCNPIGQYGILKLTGEWLVKDYSRRCNMEHVIIRPSAVYGPLDVEDRVISKFILSAMRNETLKVNGAEETLDFTFVTDAAKGIVDAALSNNTNNKTYNITKSHSHTLLEAAQLAVKIVGKGTINVRDKDADFPSRGALNIDAARRDFGFNPEIDIEEGFDQYYEWLTNR